VGELAIHHSPRWKSPRRYQESSTFGKRDVPSVPFTTGKPGVLNLPPPQDPLTLARKEYKAPGSFAWWCLLIFIIPGTETDN
jgi:hypothetical protein